MYHQLFINEVGSSWELQQAPALEKVAFLHGSPLRFLVKFLEPSQIKNVDFVEVKIKNKNMPYLLANFCSKPSMRIEKWQPDSID